MAKVTFNGFVSAEITSNIDRALPVCVKKASKALLKSDASLTNYLTFFKQCDIEDEMYRATKGRLTVELYAHQCWFQYHQRKAEIEYNTNVKHRDMLANIINSYDMTKEQYDFLHKRYFMPLQLKVELGQAFHAEAAAFFTKLHEVQMGTQSTPELDELVSKYAFGYTRLSDCEKGVFLEQMREKMSNFEESLLRSVIEENKEMKKRLEAKEKEGEAIDGRKKELSKV